MPGEQIWIIDWKTNQQAAGESDETFVTRLKLQYEPQLEAYRSAAQVRFPRHSILPFLYVTVLGRLVEGGP
jgi:ATP-dependent exoDNAse (exonuclease V) beta subunit